MQNRLDYTVNNLNTASENVTAANSRIRDTDMAKEMTKYTQMNVLAQVQAMLAQTNYSHKCSTTTRLIILTISFPFFFNIHYLKASRKRDAFLKIYNDNKRLAAIFKLLTFKLRFII